MLMIGCGTSPTKFTSTHDQSNLRNVPLGYLQNFNQQMSSFEGTKQKRASYLLLCCVRKSTSINILQGYKNGFLLSWPGIDLIQESDTTPTIVTAKGHLDQEHRNLKSTKAQASETTSLVLPTIPSSENDRKKNALLLFTHLPEKHMDV